MKSRLAGHFQNPSANFLLFLGLVFISLLVMVLYWHKIVWHLIVLPTVDFERRGVQVYYHKELHNSGESDRREHRPSTSFKFERPNSSAIAAGVMHIKEPVELQFKLEADDYGSFSLGHAKHIDQRPRDSSINRSKVTLQLDQGIHLAVLEVNNRPDAGWLKLKAKQTHSPDWSLLGEKIGIHPVQLSVFPRWWKTIPHVKATCVAAMLLMLGGVGFFYRRWPPLARFYSLIRKGDAWLCQKEHLLRKKPVQLAIFLFPLGLFFLLLGIKFNDPEYFRELAWDDSTLEYIQFWSYLAAAAISLLIVIKCIGSRLVLHTLAFGLLFLGLFFVSMEEISWGQRILNIQSSEFFYDRNVQHEMTLHNLDLVAPFLHDMYILVGLYGMFAWILLSRAKLSRNNVLNFCVPDWFFSSYFFLVFFVYKTYTYVIPYGSDYLGIDQEKFWKFWKLYDQEGVELILSLAFLGFVLCNYIRVGKLCQYLSYLEKPNAFRTNST